VHNLASVVFDLPCRGFVRVSGSLLCRQGRGDIRFRDLVEERELYREAGSQRVFFDETNTHLSTRFVLEIEFTEEFWTGPIFPQSRATQGEYDVLLEFTPWCISDVNADGGIDGGDIEAFFVAWSAGLELGDVDCNGGCDGADVDAFFRVWEAGGC